MHEPTLEAACVKRDAIVDRLLDMWDYRPGMTQRDGLLRYLIGHSKGNPNGIPTLLRNAQAEVLELMANQVEAWRT